MNAKEVLNELKWRPEKVLEKAVVHYVHRGAPNDERVISGMEIVELESSFFSTAEAMIPYHRIFRIEYEGKVILDRERQG